MIRRLGRFLKPLLLAVLVLALLPCVAEVWLHWQEFRAGRPLLSSDPQSDLLTPSWTTHQQLKPLRKITARNPDTGEPFETQTNSFGMRGPEPVVPKPTGLVRVLVVGDETMLGLDVADADTFAARLEEQLRKSLPQTVEVLNAAVPGDCPLLAALRLKHNLSALRPDLVICHFDMTDVADDYLLRRHTLLGRGDEPLACPNPLLEKPVRGVGQRWGDHFLLAKFAQRQLGEFWRRQRPDESSLDIDHPLGKYAWLADQPPDWSQYIQPTFASLGDVSQAASVMSSRLLVTTCPAPWQVSAMASSSPGVREAAGISTGTHFKGPLPFRLLGEFAKQRNLALCDCSEAFRSEPNPDRLFLHNAPHLSPAGHELYAATVATFLEANSHSIPPPSANAAPERSSGPH
jgi:hypothetical protein